MKSEYHKDWSASSTYSWNIDNCTEAEVLSVMHSMLVCYKIYLVDDIGPINSTRRIIGGFEGSSDSWLKAETIKDPLLLTNWENSQVKNANGSTYMDPFTSLPINNMIGCLLYGITVNFISFPQINNDLTAITRVAMKLHNMKHFDEYFNDFVHRLHTLSLELILEPKWKEIFVSSLPLWVSTTIVSKLPGSIGDYKFGVIRQAVKAIIVELCSQLKIARAATNPKKPHGYQQLCKQWHLSAPKNSEGRDVCAYKKKKHATKNFSGKKIIHQKKLKDYK